MSGKDENVTYQRLRQKFYVNLINIFRLQFIVCKYPIHFF